MPFGTGAKLHKTLPDVSTPHVLADLEPAVASEVEVDSRLGLNRVKLPSPGTGDYVTPSAVLGSSFLTVDMSASVLRRHTGGLLNEPNIYDSDDATFANPGSNLASNESREVIVWDLGSNRKRQVNFRHWGEVGVTRSFLDTSPDNVTWTERSLAHMGNTITGTFTANFRYIRWRCRNLSPTATANNLSYRLHTLDCVDMLPGWTIDENLVTRWRPDPPNELNAWCRWDMGALKICGGCRIYWGADTAYHPSAYRIETSEDGTTWTTVVTETVAPPASAWKEYSWPARYARFIRLIVDTHGSLGTEIFEFDYYSRIVERVASEHGHGSGVVPHLRVEYSEGHPPMRFGDTIRAARNKIRTKIRGRGRRGRENIKEDLEDLLELLERQEELMEFLSVD